jgi:non-homologous end joining protein Ku
VLIIVIDGSKAAGYCKFVLMYNAVRGNELRDKRKEWIDDADNKKCYADAEKQLSISSNVVKQEMQSIYTQHNIQ